MGHAGAELLVGFQFYWVFREGGEIGRAGVDYPEVPVSFIAAPGKHRVMGAN